MKQAVIVLLSLGLVGALANTIQSDNNNKALPEPSDSETKHEGEDILNKTEQKEPVVSFVDTGLINDGDRNGEVSITIEEDLVPPPVEIAQDPAAEVYITDVPEFPIEDNFYKTLPDSPDTYEDEIMDVAANWVPVPIFRRQKHKAHRRFFGPKHFTQNPYRRFYYYPYHAFYRPRPYFF
ncbi:uncharacterized protein LOC125230489 isoform X1 [Leguminivora glycinivorella]|uniref:uncharacterized protein LOC125230489 isoform X1 n=1 Tax=Leguminivora glycinivorella TaxID=1035111 RepID=UPI00200D2ACA|nr:uncharacterized protein LOC125230489 isoform X1 [Leguminivora glycinivorella]